MEKGRAGVNGTIPEVDEPFAYQVYLGECPECHSLIVGESRQTAFERWNAHEDEWSPITRVYPEPPKSFRSYRIPRVALNSLAEGDRALQVDANTAACLMYGRALEAVCRHVLAPKDADGEPVPEKGKKKQIMLAEGIKLLKDRKVIDERLFDWSQQLHAFRNMAAHPDDQVISRQDADDVRTFVYAIIEYIYDLAERYDEFQKRMAQRKK